MAADNGLPLQGIAKLKLSLLQFMHDITWKISVSKVTSAIHSVPWFCGLENKSIIERNTEMGLCAKLPVKCEKLVRNAVMHIKYRGDTCIKHVENGSVSRGGRTFYSWCLIFNWHFKNMPCQPVSLTGNERDWPTEDGDWFNPQGPLLCSASRCQHCWLGTGLKCIKLPEMFTSSN